MPDFAEEPWNTVVAGVRESLVPIALIVVFAYLAIRLARVFVHGIVKTLLDREATEGTAQELSAVELKKRMDTLDALGGRTLQAFIVMIGGLMVLGRIGLDIGPAIAGLGVVGIAVGFGAQSLVRDYLNGSLILIENQFGKGDVVRVAGVDGTVEDFTLRRTTLRDLDGVVHTIPNGEIRVASNLTRVWSRINEDVTVAYGTDIDMAIDVVGKVGAEMAGDPQWKRRVLEAPRVERVEALAEYGVTLKILGTVRAADQWDAGGDFRKRLLAAFKANGIEIPRPQRVVLARDPRDGGLDVGLAPDQDDLAEGTGRPGGPVPGPGSRQWILGAPGRRASGRRPGHVAEPGRRASGRRPGHVAEPGRRASGPTGGCCATSRAPRRLPYRLRAKSGDCLPPRVVEVPRSRP